MALCTSTDRTSQVLEALDLYYGFRHCRSVQFVDDVAGSLAAEYFDMNLIDENYAEVEYYVWMDNGASVDPAIAGKTGVQVTYTDGDSAAVLAGLFAAALASLDLKVLVTGDLVEYQNSFLGLITVEVSATAPSFTFAIGQAGSGGYLGAIAQGGGTLNTEQTLIDLTSDQTAAIVLDQNIQGSAISFDLSLVEMTTDRWKFIVGEGYGDSETVSLEELVGYGTSKLFRSSFDFAGQLTGHPVRLPLSDRRADVTIWKATANLNSINYSGQEVQAAEMTFTALRDSSKPEKFSLFLRGNHTLY